MADASAPIGRFRTRSGECVVSAARLELTRSGPRGALAELVSLGGRLEPWVPYAALGAALAALGGHSLAGGDIDDGGFDLVFGLGLAAVAWSQRHTSAAPTLLREAVEHVEATPPVPPITRPFFTVAFRRGRARRLRYILLPGAAEGGAEEFARASELLRAAGWLPPEPSPP